MSELRVRTSQTCGVYCARRADAVVIAIVETIDDTGAIQQLVDAAAGLIPAALPAADWPATFGDLLHELMLDAGERRALASPGPFAAVACSADEIHVVTAGNVRVHALDGASLVAVSRDHILRTEPGEATAAVIARHGTSPSRAIGGNAYRPERVTWPTPSAPVLVVCTEEVHRYRTPADYAADPWRDAGDAGAIVVATIAADDLTPTQRDR